MPSNFLGIGKKPDIYIAFNPSFHATKTQTSRLRFKAQITITLGWITHETLREVKGKPV